jgi:hypothetical protein
MSKLSEQPQEAINILMEDMAKRKEVVYQK